MINQPKYKRNLKKRLGNECVYCKCTNPLLLTVDHIVPLSRKGTDNDENKQVCCYFCNQLKGSLTHKEFKNYYKSLLTLKSLGKLRITNLPNRIELEFKSHHYPEFNFSGIKEQKLPVEKRPIKK